METFWHLKSILPWETAYRQDIFNGGVVEPRRPEHALKSHIAAGEHQPAAAFDIGLEHIEAVDADATGAGIRRDEQCQRADIGDHHRLIRAASRLSGNSAAQRSPPICVTVMPAAAIAALNAVAPLVQTALVTTSLPAATDVVAAKVSPASNTFIVAPHCPIDPGSRELREGAR